MYPRWGGRGSVVYLGIGQANLPALGPLYLGQMSAKKLCISEGIRGTGGNALFPRYRVSGVTRDDWSTKLVTIRMYICRKISLPYERFTTVC